MRAKSFCTGMREWGVRDLRPQRCRNGITLIEILVVVAILGILMVLLFPVAGSVMESSKAAKCAGNLRQISAAVGLFAGDNNMRLPPARQAPLSTDIFAPNSLVSSWGSHRTDNAMLLMKPAAWMTPLQIQQRAPFGYVDDPRIFYSPTQDIYRPDLASWTSKLPAFLFQTTKTSASPTVTSRIGYNWIAIRERASGDPLAPYRNDNFLLMPKPMPLITTFGLPCHPEVLQQTTPNSFINVLFTDGSVRKFDKQALVGDIPAGNNNSNFAKVLARMTGQEVP